MQPAQSGRRVWSPEELRRIGEICLRNGVFVVADEIHCELVMPGFRYTPFASLGEEFLHNSVTCCSPSKAFNLAGLQVANIIAAGETVRAKIEKALRINETGEIGPLAIDALIAAYDRGAEWLDALNEYLHANYLFRGSTSRSTCRTAPYCRWKAPIWCGRTAGPRDWRRTNWRNVCSPRADCASIRARCTVRRAQASSG